MTYENMSSGEFIAAGVGFGARYVEIRGKIFRVIGDGEELTEVAKRPDGEYIPVIEVEVIEPQRIKVIQG